MCIRWRTFVSLIPFAEGGDGGGFAEDVIADLNVQLTYINSVYNTRTVTSKAANSFSLGFVFGEFK